MMLSSQLGRDSCKASCTPVEAAACLMLIWTAYRLDRESCVCELLVSWSAQTVTLSDNVTLH